jgi:predicted metal-dependent phosphoesterase TrpH
MCTVRYDLHSHTTASDGSLTPTELVAHARSCGVDCLAVTDHDNTDGLTEAHQAAAAHGLSLVTGIEISVSWSGQTVHIVGLQIDPKDDALQAGLARLQAFRHWRGQEIARRLERAGIAGSYEGAQRYAEGKILSRTHFARYLVEQGYASEMKKVFKKYLTHNKPGYVPGDWATLEEALGWIHGAGGLAVVAHPARYRLSGTRLRQLLGEFRELGGSAIEVVSGSHSRDDIDRFSHLARQFGFYASRGSDYHGPVNAYAAMERLPELPDDCCALWDSEAWQQHC